MPCIRKAEEEKIPPAASCKGGAPGEFPFQLIITKLWSTYYNYCRITVCHDILNIMGSDFIHIGEHTFGADISAAEITAVGELLVGDSLFSGSVDEGNRTIVVNTGNNTHMAYDTLRSAGTAEKHQVAGLKIGTVYFGSTGKLHARSAWKLYSGTVAKHITCESRAVETFRTGSTPNVFASEKSGSIFGELAGNFILFGRRIAIGGHCHHQSRLRGSGIGVEYGRAANVACACSED